MHRDATSLSSPRRAILLSGLVLLWVAADAAAAIPPGERAALIALYNGTNGAAWTSRTRWRNAADTDFAPAGTECTWYGVTCDGSAAHVTRLDLSYNELAGPIPADIAGLAALEWLDLGGNRLAGSIPPQIGSLASLSYLSLSHATLTGSIPAQVGNLTGLTYLMLSDTLLTGPIPPEVGNLTNLKMLSLGYGGLTGSIPAEIGNLTKLEALELGPNQLTGPIPPEIGNLSHLLEVVLWDNRLSGPIPPEIGNLTALLALWLNDNRLTGAIPDQIGNLTALQDLNLSGNELTGSIPPEIGQLSSLWYLDLQQNELTGPIPAQIGQLGMLSELSLDANQLTGSIPLEMGNLTRLGLLSLADNQLTGPIPAQICTLPLGHLSLAHNLLSGSIPQEIGNLRGLDWLDLGGNQLTGAIPPEIGNLDMSSYKSPGVVRLDHNQLSGPIPPEIGDIGWMRELHLDYNQLSGPIPPEIGAIGTPYAYGSLRLGHNQLTGAVPTEIILAPLIELDLEENHLSGPIPPGIGSVARLQHLTLSGNRFSGTIPAGIGNLTKLVELGLAGNQLEGPIPSSLANLSALQDGGSDFRWNALHTGDEALAAFLDTKQIGGDWQGTQTVAPSGVAAAPATLDTVPLSWLPIPYTGDTGSYRIWYTTRPGGPYELGATSADKSASAAPVSGLSAGTTYYFTLDTMTEPHASNQNTVVSERSIEVSATTSPGGVGWHTLAVVSYGPGTVSSSPAAVACGGACSATFAPGTSVTLTAAPEPGSTFLGWGGDCAGTAVTCDLAMDSPRSVTARFSTPALSFYTVEPCRVFDSRDPYRGGPFALAAGTSSPIQVAGYCRVPATARVVSLNVTVVSPTTGGHLRLYASGTPRPGASSINYAPGQTRANDAVVSLGADGGLVVDVTQPSGTVHVVLDVNGYFQ